MVGIHVKIKGIHDLRPELQHAMNIGCDHVQLMNEVIDKKSNLKKILQKYHLKLIIHGPFTINIANDIDVEFWKAKRVLVEIYTAIYNGASGIVFHMGRLVDKPKEVGFRNMYKLLNYICPKVEEMKKGFKIYLETTSGQGNELCYKMDDLGIFYKMIKNNKKMENVLICLDTCHLFTAGYDLRTIDEVDNFLLLFDTLVGIKNVGLIHMNDSVEAFNSKRDHHAGIGEGFIGLIGLKHFYEKFKKLHVPIILETPLGNYEREIKLLDDDIANRNLIAD